METDCQVIVNVRFTWMNFLMHHILWYKDDIFLSTIKNKNQSKQKFVYIFPYVIDSLHSFIDLQCVVVD